MGSSALHLGLGRVTLFRCCISGSFNWLGAGLIFLFGILLFLPNVKTDGTNEDNHEQNNDNNNSFGCVLHKVLKVLLKYYVN